MSKSALYILKGYGPIEPSWLQACFGLFKKRGINIRKLILLKNGNPNCFSMLEIHFLLPLPEDDDLPHPFLTSLATCLSQQQWAEQTLTLS